MLFDVVLDPHKQTNLMVVQLQALQLVRDKLDSWRAAMLKGEGWQGNQNAGLVHRSPAIPPGDSRLLLTLDFSNQ